MPNLFFTAVNLAMCASGVIKLWVVLIKSVGYIAACCLSASPFYSLTLNAGGFVAGLCVKLRAQCGSGRFWHCTERN